MSAAKIEAINEDHARRIRDACIKVIEQESKPKPKPQPVMVERNGRMVADDNRNLHDLGELLSVPEGDSKKLLSMKDVLASANRQTDATTEVPWYVDVESNRDLEVAMMLLKDIRTLLKGIPVRTREWEYLWEQRMVMAAMSTSVSRDLHIKVNISRENMEKLTPKGCRKTPFSAAFTQPACTGSRCVFANYATGAGKTSMAIAAALMGIADKEKWEENLADFRKIVTQRYREQHSGLVAGFEINELCLARLVIAMVPVQLLGHWLSQAETVIFGLREVLGMHVNIRLWRGKSMLHSIKHAYDSGEPTFWILPMEAASLQELAKHPKIQYTVCIYDELSKKQTDRWEKPISQPNQVYVTQATLDALSNSLVGSARHPVREAFKGQNFISTLKLHQWLNSADYKNVQISLQHLCRMLHFSAPPFLRRLLAEGVQRHMPRGLHIYKLDLRLSTVTNIVTGSVVDMSLPDLVSQMLDRCSPEWKDKVLGIFNRAVVLTSSDVLSELDHFVEKIVVRDHRDLASRASIEKLAKRLKECFGDMKSNSLLDPVSLDPIKPEELCLCRHCTAFFSKSTVELLRSTEETPRCPICRASIAIVEVAGGSASKMGESEAAGASGHADEAAASDVSVGGNAAGKREVGSEPHAPKKRGPAADSSDDEDDEDHAEILQSQNEEQMAAREAAKEAAFAAVIRGISEKPPPAVEGIMMLLKQQCIMVPDARILLCFAFSRQQTAIISAITRRINQDIPSVSITNIESLKTHEKAEPVLKRYKKREANPAPQLLLINTLKDLSGVSGMDLPETDLTVVADACSLATQRQAAGRALRMQALGPNGQRPPAKNVVVITLGQGGRPLDVDSDDEMDDFLEDPPLEQIGVRQQDAVERQDEQVLRGWRQERQQRQRIHEQAAALVAADAAAEAEDAAAEEAADSDAEDLL